MRQIGSYILVSLIVSGITLAGYHFSGIGQQVVTIEKESNSMGIQASESMPTYRMPASGSAPTDFHFAAKTTMPAVVHIKSIHTVSQRYNDPFYEFFGVRPQRRNSRQQVSSGSGVIISTEGYIVTNNHVIKDADELDVTLYDNRTYKATVIGTDPSTDLGLIKIEAKNLSTIEIGNSDNVQVGTWVLAVGNPFSLASTATAGIVSAIGRDLEIIKDQMAIESFIQTDAAVNPGNSGGALVNLEGELIGVNTAIASPTGAYAGYAFAVPANIVRKVVNDLKEFGTVQRAFLGIRYMEALNGEIAQEKGVSVTEGVYINELVDFGGARKAGIEEGDVIVSIDGIKIKNDAKLLELVGRNRPGDRIDVKIIRKGKFKNFNVQLTNRDGSIEVVAPVRNETLNELGAEFRELTDREKDRIGTERGILISKLYAGKIRRETDIKENFIVLKVNDRPVESVQELMDDLENSRGRTVKLTGFYPQYNRLYSFTFEM